MRSQKVVFTSVREFIWRYGLVSTLQERYGMRSGRWVEEEDALLVARCRELVEEGLVEEEAGLLAAIHSQTGSTGGKPNLKGKGKGKRRDPKARTIIGLYLGQVQHHDTWHLTTPLNWHMITTRTTYHLTLDHLTT